MDQQPSKLDYAAIETSRTDGIWKIIVGCALGMAWTVLVVGGGTILAGTASHRFLLAVNAIPEAVYQLLFMAFALAWLLSTVVVAIDIVLVDRFERSVRIVVLNAITFAVYSLAGAFSFNWNH